MAKRRNTGKTNITFEMHSTLCCRTKEDEEEEGEGMGVLHCVVRLKLVFPNMSWLTPSHLIKLT